ncbi:MAG: thiamine pyrophosphate-dependent enzyme [Candidatus Bathyarchaeia archaeon]
MVLTPMTGNKAFATGVKLARAQVIAAYPITPQTTVIEYLSNFVNNGELDAEYIRAEGEHGMMAQSIGAAETGARTFVSTCSAGFAYGFQGVVSAPGFRLGNLMMACINRPIGVPGGLQADHSDSMTARDWGWLQFYGETAQELTDTAIMAYKVGEDHRVLLPTMVCGEGYYLSYTTELVDVPDQGDVDDFLPPFKPVGRLDPDNPMSTVPFGPPEFMMAVHYTIAEAAKRAVDVIKEVNEEFYKKFGRRYGNGLVEEYKMDGADVALVAMGSFTGNARGAVDVLREKGKKVGLVKIKSYRPFPSEDFRRIAEDVKAFVVMQRHHTVGGASAPVSYDLMSALYDMEDRPLSLDVVSGLCGVEVGVDDFVELANMGLDAVKKGVAPSGVIWYPRMSITERYDVPPMTEEDKSKIVYSGTGTCQGCGMAIGWRHILETIGRNSVIVSNAGCGGWSGTKPGYLPHTIPFGVGGAAGNLPAGAATATGIKRGLRIQGRDDVNVVLIAGDGSFGDMGFMAASGAAERNEDILMIVYDNEAYMNTGIQRSGSTPYKAWTTTTPVGRVVKGKEAQKKDLPAILAAHRIPYVATASPAYIADFKRKIKKALSIRGCKYIHFYSPCPTGHRYPSDRAIEVSRLVVQSGMLPLYEIEEGKFRFTVKPKERVPVSEYLRTQGRFRHLTDEDIEEIQKITEQLWTEYEELEKKA